MTISLSDPVPSYDAPAAHDNIIHLSQTALSLQDRFSNIRHTVGNLSKGVNVHDAPSKLLEIDERYNAVFSESRSAATALEGHIRRFVNQVVPLASQSDIDLEERRTVVRTVADGISQAANQNAGVFDDTFPPIITDLKAVFDTIKGEEIKFRIESKAVLDQASRDIELLVAYIKDNGTIFARLSNAGAGMLNYFRGKPTVAPAPPIRVKIPASGAKAHAGLAPLQFVFDSVKRISDFITGGPALKATAQQLEESIQELITLKESIEKQVREIAAALHDVDEISKGFIDLEKYAASFKAVWEKIARDASTLRADIDLQTANEVVLVERVMSEVDVYRNILIALDEYALAV